MNRPKFITGIVASLALLLSPFTAFAANQPSNSTRVQGTPDGYGAPVQVTIVDNDGDDATITATTAGSSAISAAASENPVYQGCVYQPTLTAIAAGDKIPCVGDILGAQLGNHAGIATATGDGLVVGQIAGTRLENGGSVYYLPIQSVQYQYNGTSWDNVRGVSNGANTTGTGIQAVGNLAQADDASITACTENSFCNLRLSLTNHALVVQPYETPANSWQYASGTTGILSNTTTAVTIKTAAGAGIRNYIKTCQITTTAFGAAVPLAIRDGAGGTVIWSNQVATSGWLTPQNITFEPPIRGTANTLLEVVTTTANTSGTAMVNCQGFVAP